MRIHIISYYLLKNDAVGNFCIDLGELLEEKYEILYYSDNSEYPERSVKEIQELSKQICKNDIIIYSYSIYDPNLEEILNLNNKKICYFHNVTPAKYFFEYDYKLYDLCNKSINQIEKLSLFNVLICNSNFTKNFLKTFDSFNGSTIFIKPPVFKKRILFNKYEKCMMNEKFTFLYVGRLVPHKKIENIIELFGLLYNNKKNINLKIVGKGLIPKYSEMLHQQVINSGLLDVVEFYESVDIQELIELYKEADAFLMMSEHEGFCIPILEALFFNLKIFVLEGNASSEISGPYGIILNENIQDNVNIILDKLEQPDTVIDEERRKYIDNFLNENLLEKYTTIIEDLLWK